MQFLLLRATDEHGNLYKPLLVYLMSQVFLPKKLKDVCSLQTGYDYLPVSDGSKATLLQGNLKA
jgi:hypothetical protein